MTLRVAVLGGGLMGQGIARCLAGGGHDVAIYDSSPETPRTVESLEAAVADADWVIETVVEIIEPKLALLTAVERLARDTAVVSSNTSTFLPSALASGLRRPGRFINTHFFRPADVVPLVEVIPSPATEPSVVETVAGWLRDIGKSPIVLSREVPGFVANRLQAAVLREAIHLHDEGVLSVEDIDAVVQLSLGPRWAAAGPFMIADLGGLDVFGAVCANVFASLATDQNVQPTLNRLVSEGRLGAKSGDGFYHDPALWEAASTRITRQFQRSDQSIV